MKIHLRTRLLLAGMLLLISHQQAWAHTDVTPAQAHDLIDSTPNLVVVDVREPSEYCGINGHIPGALNYPLNTGVLQDRYEELPMNDPILVVCQSGGRSNQAANFLDSKGFTIVYDMMGGMNSWQWETEPCKYSDRSGSYVFLPDQSTVHQTGGFAGVNETYPIQGQFQLTVDANSSVASFNAVDAILLNPTGFLYTQSLDDLRSEEHTV